MKMPGYTAEYSLPETGGYVAAPNKTTVKESTIVPALMKKYCEEESDSTIHRLGLWIRSVCQTCQWYKQETICEVFPPRNCRAVWIPVGSPSSECASSLVGID
jgi:hypothetical protein